ncbi:MAG: T9SS type A sorting domain-containing protein [Fimbriimonadaceae bacterium]|nr:T9SS type A sorting domain-containing protein [Chitinophagales bacterium]
MKKILVLFLSALPFLVYTQCTTSDATDCDCLGGSGDCDLLPDMTASYDLLAEEDETVEEEGILYLSIGTPNIGHGPLRVLPTDYYVCGGDTIYDVSGIDACPDGSEPHQIIKQRIYHKNGTEMTYWEQNAGTMTYHPSHGHFHTDNWGEYTLRKKVDGIDDPTEWTVIGYGTKMGFCLMDLANCASGSSYGYCRDNDGNVLTNDGPNYGLGGGNYDCDINNQGISCGYLDIYDYYLDGMSIEIPAGVCNGDYYIVAEIDPNDNYLEEHDDNNVIAVPYTLTEQPEDIDFFPVTVAGGEYLCAGETIELSVSPVGTSYLWSNGATTNSISITEPGTYYCDITRDCGPGHSDTVTIISVPVEEPVITTEDIEVCYGTSAILNATGAEISWYDSETGGLLIGAGETFTTSELTENTTYFVANTETAIFAEGYAEPHDFTGTNEYSEVSYNGYLMFDVFADMTLKSVRVYTDESGLRKILLHNATGSLIQSAEVDTPVGESVAELNFNIPAGENYKLTTDIETNNESLGYDGPRLKRVNGESGGGEIDFPYNVGGLASITASSADERYYYFFDWQYEASETCTSHRLPVEVAVKVCDAIGDIHDLTYFEIFPNPNNGNFIVNLNVETSSDIKITISNSVGQEIYNNNLNSVYGELSLPVNAVNNAKGIYNLQLVINGELYNKQIIIQ